jgi:signal transduction histidine kinase
LKLKTKLNNYILTFFLLVTIVVVIGDVIKFQNYKKMLIQNYSNKYINLTQQIRDDYRLLFDRLQYQFDKQEAVNISKLNQLYKIYQRDSKYFNVDKAAEELNKDVYFGHYEVFLINKDCIIEDASYKTDIGLNFSSSMEIREIISSIFTKKSAIDISPIIVDLSSMLFNRYLIRLSNDEKYILQTAFTLDSLREFKAKYDLIKNVGLIELYLANTSLEKFEFDKTNHEKLFLKQEGWENTKNFIFQLANDLTIKNKRLEALTKLDVRELLNNDKYIKEAIDEVFSNDNLLNSLNLSQHYFTIYTITDGLFNKSTGTKLIIKTTYSTESLENDIQKTFIQGVIQLFFILIILILIYLFIIRKLSNPLLKIIDNIKNNQYSDISDIKIAEMTILNGSYNDLHNRLNKEIERSANILKDKNQFIADTVHQLRTPLTNIMMNGEMIKQFQTDKSLSSYIDKIDSSINMLSNFYEDLAYVASADTIEYSPININLSDFLKKRIEFFSTISKVSHKEIQATIEEDIFTHINQIELERIIDNNLSNAMKYASKNKPVIINLLQLNGSARLIIKTYGIQIKDKNKIFEKNYRENEAKRGLGLGLNMVKNICEKYHIPYNVTYENGQNVFTYLFQSSILDVQRI